MSAFIAEVVVSPSAARLGPISWAVMTPCVSASATTRTGSVFANTWTPVATLVASCRRTGSGLVVWRSMKLLNNV